MKKIFVSLAATFIIIILIAYILYSQFNSNKILENLEKKTELSINLIGKNIWNFFPIISFKNNDVQIADNQKLFIIQNADIDVKKNYWPFSPILIDIKNAIINYEGMEIRNANINSQYSNNIFYIKNFTGNSVQGKIYFKGSFDLDESQPFKLDGNFENISLNTLLKQSKITNWNRVNIKLSSSNFVISGNVKEKLLLSINGSIPLEGSLYFTTTEEERFGAAFLSLLTEKIPALKSVSQSIDFLLANFANIPSSINGTLIVNNGFISSDEIVVRNKTGKFTLKGSYNFIKNNLDGKLFLYKKNSIFLEASIKGNLQDPQILVDGKNISKKNEEHQDIKKLLEKGINSFIDKLLSSND